MQPHSGAQANQAVYMALLQPGDTFLGMSLAEGGHLTHGSPVSMSGKCARSLHTRLCSCHAGFKAVSYGVDPVTHLIDYDKVAALALEHKPKVRRCPVPRAELMPLQMIVAGASSYSRAIDFKRFREIADSVGAFFWVDMAHYAGLARAAMRMCNRHTGQIAAGLYPDPLPHAHVVTSTTHKTLRGPRGGIILSNDIELGKKLNSAVFPGLQVWRDAAR